MPLYPDGDFLWVNQHTPIELIRPGILSIPEPINAIRQPSSASILTFIPNISFTGSRNPYLGYLIPFTPAAPYSGVRGGYNGYLVLPPFKPEISFGQFSRKETTYTIPFTATDPSGLKSIKYRIYNSSQSPPSYTNVPASGVSQTYTLSVENTDSSKDIIVDVKSTNIGNEYIPATKKEPGFTDTIKPIKPSWLSVVSSGTNQWRFSWDISSDNFSVKYYKIYEVVNSNNVLFEDNVMFMPHVHSGDLNNKTFNVSAVDYAGNESLSSDNYTVSSQQSGASIIFNDFSRDDITYNATFTVTEPISIKTIKYRIYVKEDTPPDYTEESVNKVSFNKIISTDNNDVTKDMLVDVEWVDDKDNVKKSSETLFGAVTLLKLYIPIWLSIDKISDTSFKLSWDSTQKAGSTIKYNIYEIDQEDGSINATVVSDVVGYNHTLSGSGIFNKTYALKAIDQDLNESFLSVCIAVPISDKCPKRLVGYA